MERKSWLHFRPGPRRIVFWGAIGAMLAAAVVGMTWYLIAGGPAPGPIAVLKVGIGAFVVALAFALLEHASPTFHPESELFSWDDVDALREIARRPGMDQETRDFARSLADRVAVVLPGRPASETEPPPRRRSARR